VPGVPSNLAADTIITRAKESLSMTTGALRTAITITAISCITFTAVSQTSIIPYARVGYLVTPPSVEDLGFSGAVSEDLLDVNGLGYGAGAQFTFGIGQGFVRSLGFEIAMNWLMSYTYEGDPGASSRWEGEEYSVSVLALVEFRPKGSPIILMAGLGGHSATFNESREFSGTYTYEYESDTYNDFSFALMLAGGVDLPLGTSVSMPLMARFDILDRYSSYIVLSASIGVRFKL